MAILSYEETWYLTPDDLQTARQLENLVRKNGGKVFVRETGSLITVNAKKTFKED